MLCCRGLKRVFVTGHEPLTVFHDVSLELSSNEMVCIVGASGSGKSTLLQLLGLLDTPTEGVIEIEGRDVSLLRGSEIDALRRRMFGFVFQFHHLLPEFSAFENIALPGRIARRSQSESEQKAWELLEMIGLKDRASHRPAELSGGEQQRVAVARALVNQPKVLLMDEPTGNLDRENGLRVLEILDALREQNPLAVLMVTHNPEIADKADRILTLEDGQIR